MEEEEQKIKKQKNYFRYLEDYKSKLVFKWQDSVEHNSDPNPVILITNRKPSSPWTRR